MVRPVGNQFNPSIGPACIYHWFWWFWSSNPTWLGTISSRSVLGNILGPFWALGQVPCSPPSIHMDFWWWTKGVNMERVPHLVDYEKCLWRWFPRLMRALSRSEGGKNESGSGRRMGSSIKSQNEKRERPFPLHFCLWGKKLCPSFVKEKNRVWRRFWASEKVMGAREVSKERRE